MKTKWTPEVERLARSIFDDNQAVAGGYLRDLPQSAGQANLVDHQDCFRPRCDGTLEIGDGPGGEVALVAEQRAAGRQRPQEL